MPINQPSNTQDPADASWKLEVTTTLNNLEQRFGALLEAIQQSTDSDIDNLKARTRDL